ncbi:uncharacterized protein BDV14DRAFT_137577 [Aspergillus stella-maris]|uniref:uncharacterized protein n=1 Tax=Aspergillus stella-maris TaxID=1810926 RepID=UPI003CCD6FF8
MPKQDSLDLLPLGWEDDPEEERFKISTLDYLTVPAYFSYALFFQLGGIEKGRVIEVKAGLERTLSQTRHLCGTIEQDPTGDHCFVKKRDSTVRFVVQSLDTPEESEVYPSFDDIAQHNFCGSVLGNLDDWTIAPMTTGIKLEAHPDSGPAAAAFKANFIQGGLVFIIHQHHYANDANGWAGFAHQLAENCYATVNHTQFPAWDPLCLDLSCFIRPDIPEESRIDGLPAMDFQPNNVPIEMLLFHLPKSKAAALKELATPPNGSQISTYDAFSAFLWRTVTRLRAPISTLDLSRTLPWSGGIDMRRRIHTHSIHPRTQQNVLIVASSGTAPGPINPPTIAEVVSLWPLSKLASYIRQITNSATQESLDSLLDSLAPVRDKPSLWARMPRHEPSLLNIIQTDHRSAAISSANFGFARHPVYRVLTDQLMQGIVVIYPPRDPDPFSDEGPEFSIVYEVALKEGLIEDEEWRGYFEYRGVDAVDKGSH